MAEASWEGNEDTQENYDLDTSRKLNSILNDLGLTKKSISNRRYSMQLLNICCYVPISDEQFMELITYISGSTVEGVASIADENSDVDFMMISPINVINGIDQIDNQVKHFPIQNGVYILEDSTSHFLFKRLRFLVGENTKDHYHHSNGYIYLSHGDFAERCHDARENFEKIHLEWLPITPSYTVERCGPSVAQCFYDFLKFDIDLVVSIFCPFWPNEIHDFFIRHRPQQWPTPRDLDLIKRNGCHLVAKGFEGSLDNHIEWRLSFSFAENILIRSFNNIQMKCYYLLKQFLKTDIKPRFPKLLCSYHMKTVMFWVCEEIGPNPFKQRFLLKCFRLCIDRVRGYLFEGHFPCYFARESNLLSETVPSEAYRKLAEFVSVVYHEETTTNFMYHLKGRVLHFKRIYLPAETMDQRATVYWMMKMKMERYIRICEGKSKTEVQSFLNCVIFDTIKKSLFNYSEWNIMNMLCQIVLPDLSFTAIALLRRRNLRNKVHYTLQKLYLQLMTNELAVTHSRGLLKRATVYYKTGQFTRCMVIAVNIINLLTATRALCFGVHNEDIFRFCIQLQNTEYLFPYGNIYTTPSVTFSELDKPLVPDFVIEEINFDEHIGDESTKGLAFLDPVIYAYALAIICQHEQSEFGARDQFLQELQYFFLQNKHRVAYQNAAKRIIDHFIRHFRRQ